ncbi:hypothetical protein ABGN05_04110 [Aquibium sp. LZ166]|uniref:Uncharacterized protein n=1 Tax=Aquibium pacificus TaxID=3153579 RepID=A0ABV3SEV1_9HYPH
MSRYYKQMQHGDNEAARALRERLAREELGDAGYEKSLTRADNRSVRLGIVFLILVAVVVFGVAWLGY